MLKFSVFPPASIASLNTGRIDAVGASDARGTSAVGHRYVHAVVRTCIVLHESKQKIKVRGRHTS